MHYVLSKSMSMASLLQYQNSNSPLSMYGTRASLPYCRAIREEQLREPVTFAHIHTMFHATQWPQKNKTTYFPCTIGQLTP